MIDFMHSLGAGIIGIGLFGVLYYLMGVDYTIISQGIWTGLSILLSYLYLRKNK